jgi:hypothetical protein
VGATGIKIEEEEEEELYYLLVKQFNLGLKMYVGLPYEYVYSVY